jgi:hypothetical protein
VDLHSNPILKPEALRLNPETISICTQIDAFTGLLRKHGQTVKGYTPSGVQHFNSLEKSQRETILRQFQAYSELCIQADAEGISLRDNKELSMSILKKLGVASPKNFFEHLEEQDIVEIYNTEGVQIFRNFVFYAHCSYTLLELLSHPWYELLERHGSMTKIIGEHIQVVLGDGNETIPSTVPAHTMRELFSEENRMFTSRFKHFAPLFAGAGKKTGFICSGSLSHIPQESPATVTFM